MKKEIKEWRMVAELHGMLDDLKTDDQQVFIKGLYDNLDPYEPFIFQQSDAQQKWLYSLYEKYCNEDTEASTEIYDE